MRRSGFFANFAHGFFGLRMNEGSLDCGLLLFELKEMERPRFFKTCLSGIFLTGHHSFPKGSSGGDLEIGLRSSLDRACLKRVILPKGLRVNSLERFQRRAIILQHLLYGDAGVCVLEGTLERDKRALAVAELWDQRLGQFERDLFRRREVRAGVDHLEIIILELPTSVQIFESIIKDLI
jgi:hypothetical protein